MKNLFIYLFLLCLIISVNAENLTNEQLIQIVKKFENNQNLQNLKLTDTINENYYRIENEVNHKTWEIDKTHEIVNYYFNSNMYNLEENMDNAMFSQNQCLNVALNYLNSKNISILQFEPIPQITIEDDCYAFYFYKYLLYPIKSSQYIIVKVNAITGEISNYYFSLSADPIISTLPNITNNEIIGLIYSIFNQNEIHKIDIDEMYYDEDYNTICINVVINDGEYIVDLDSYNKVILNVCASLSEVKNIINEPMLRIKSINLHPSKLKTKKYEKLTDIEISSLYIKNKQINFILCDTENPKDVKYTDISTEFEIDKEDKGIARMEVNGNKFIFRNGSYWCFINNKTYNMDGNCIIKDGKLQLPEDFYKKVQTKDYDFFSKSQKQLIK